MMFHLTGVPGKKAVLGPADWYRLEEGRLIAGPSGEIVAVHEDKFWRAGDSLYTSLTCSGPVSCHFEGGSHRRDDVEGPFATVMLIDGMLWGDELTLARYECDSRRWVLLHTGNDFQSVVLRLVAHHPGPRRNAR